MSPQTSEQPSVESYIAAQRKAGATNEQISMQLMQAGWSLEHVNQVLNAHVPIPVEPVLNNMTAQTSNAGTPLQIENVQYNMKVKPVQSKVGFYIKVAGAALWFTTIFISSFLSALVHKIAGDGGDVAGIFVFTLSLAIVTTPIFVVAYRKFLAEQRKNPATFDDIFFKQAVRRSLWAAVVFGAIAAVATIYQMLAAAFLKDSGASFTGGFSALMFTLGFGGLVYFYWRLHSQTRR